MVVKIKNQKQKKKIKKNSAVLVLFVCLCAAAVTYVVQVNRLATMGYEIKQKENKIADLKKENELLTIKTAELRSMHKLEGQKEDLKMGKPQMVSFIEVDVSVAMKN